MTGDEAYDRDLGFVVQRIRDCAPSDLAERFGRISGFSATSYKPCDLGFDGSVTAVDGSNVMLLDGGLLSIAAVRAAESTFSGSRRLHRSTTPLRLVSIGPEATNTDFPALFQECFGKEPPERLDNEDRSRAVAVIRDLLEYWMADQIVGTLHRGDVLVLDGALGSGHGGTMCALKHLLQHCVVQRVHAAAVTKRTEATWGEGLPLVAAVAGCAERYGVPAPWYTKVPTDLLDADRHQEWRLGEIYVAQFHPRARGAFKVELPRGLTAEEERRTLSALASFSGDGRIAGYPYPLLDAHLTAVIREDAAVQMRHDLTVGLARIGLTSRGFFDLFGDYHDEFSRF